MGRSCELNQEVVMATAEKSGPRPALTQLHYSVDIAAPREKVWRVLWDDASFRDWSSVFAEGSYAVSDWKEGSTVQFIDPGSNSGMSAVIERQRPNEFISFRHEAEIKDGKVQPPADWSGVHENYTLTSRNGGTTLKVDLDAADEHRKMFEDTFPKALQRVKELAEG
jgi:uncharacterized protein YndB with AHSA1/START domain